MRFALLLPLATVFSATPFPITLSCTRGSSPGALPRFWRSVGYTPASYALRDDELENTALIGAVPRRGITQVRIHYLLDLIEVLGWLPSSTTPSGWALSYNWGALDHALDFLHSSRLSPGFELMGSPMGFPTLPISFWQPYSGNGKVAPDQTLQLWRQLTADLLVRCVQRYGKAEVEAWHLESW
jgi:L-iduronidase